MSSWIDISNGRMESDEELIESAASAIAAGEVIAWFQGRSEVGQRALGAR